MQNINSIIKILVVVLVLVVGLILAQNHYSKVRQDAVTAQAEALKADAVRAEAAAEQQKLLAQQQAQDKANAENDALLIKVKQSMKDPDSTQFKELKFGAVENQPAVCGQLNAKNGFGAYGGFEGFYAGFTKDGNLEFYMQTDTSGLGSMMYPLMAKKLGCIQ